LALRVGPQKTPLGRPSPYLLVAAVLMRRTWLFRWPLSVGVGRVSNVLRDSAIAIEMAMAVG
jgi:hypothetical protein